MFFENVYPKIYEIRRVLDGANVHGFCVVESWLSVDINSSLVRINGFRSYRCDRTSTKGGGVIVYIRPDIKARILAKSSTTLERLFLDISLELYIYPIH